jgi:hypothetical protein
LLLALPKEQPVPPKEQSKLSRIEGDTPLRWKRSTYSMKRIFDA